MDLPINHNRPTIMHVDLNSCFATIEQQANPLLRGKPIAVTAYNSPNGCVLAPSIEAKKRGVKVGMTVREARLLCSDIIILTPDPAKYRDVHLKFKKLFYDYSPNVTPKSIDEAIIDFSGTQALKRDLTDIGYEIKKRMRAEIGEWISCNIGISTNRFLAKLAAGLHKPDGLDIIDHNNLRDVLGRVELLDLCGINLRYQARLNTHGIFTPLQLLDTPLPKLSKQVFASICGYYWYMRLRGWEIDAVDFSRKSFGQSYALGDKTDDKEKLSRLIYKLTEKMGRRLRKAGFVAYGIDISIVYTDWTHSHQSKKFADPLFTTPELYRKVQLLFNKNFAGKRVAKLAVSCFDLRSSTPAQMDLFNDSKTKSRAASLAADKINDTYGEFIITPAIMLGMHDLVLDRIAFGGIKDLSDP